MSKIQIFISSLYKRNKHTKKHKLDIIEHIKEITKQLNNC